MTYLKKILFSIFVLITMFSFLISTTGFTFYTHHCQHHNSQKSIVTNVNGCCSSQVTAIKDEESCCEPANCQTEQNQSTCCSEEISYYRLSDWFAPNNVQKKQIISEINILISSLGIEFDENEFLKITPESNHEPGPSLKVPIYRMYSQAKLDPPLS